ncbi:MAG TPA: CHAD domain-containing protein, partial [Prolixibacteraceae bacterium]|nr:CHAD domain-containing protein [Prolixibacteraceae bacterium]
KKYKKWNKAARNIARLGAELRQREVAVNALGNVKNRFDWKSDYQFYQIARAKLRRDHQKYKKELLEEQHFEEEIIERLEEAKEKVSVLEYDKTGFKAFEKGLERVYKRGRKAYKKCRKKSTTANHHEWRKRVKYLWCEIRILKETWPNGLKGYAKELHNLSDLLGDDHDLNDLKGRLQKIYLESDYTDDLAKTEALIDQFSEEIRNDAWQLGERIYAEKPKDFVKRIGKYWDAAQSMS